MRCVKCGKELPDTAKFCPFCGQSIKQEEVPAFNTAADSSETVLPAGVQNNVAGILEEQPAASNNLNESESHVFRNIVIVAGILFAVFVIWRSSVLINEKGEETGTAQKTYSTVASTTTAAVTTTQEPVTFSKENVVESVTMEKYEGQWQLETVGITIYHDGVQWIISCSCSPRADGSVALGFYVPVEQKSDGSISANYSEDGWGGRGKVRAWFENGTENLYVQIIEEQSSGWGMGVEGYAEKVYRMNYAEVCEKAQAYYDAGRFWTCYDSNGDKYTAYINEGIFVIQVWQNEKLTFSGAYPIYEDGYRNIFFFIKDVTTEYGSVGLDFYGTEDNLKMEATWAVPSSDINGKMYYEYVFNNCFGGRAYELEQRELPLSQSANIQLMQKYEGKWIDANGTSINIYQTSAGAWGMDCESISTDGGYIACIELSSFELMPDGSIFAVYFNDGQNNIGTVYASYGEESGGMYVRISVYASDIWPGNRNVKSDGYFIKRCELSAEEIWTVCGNVIDSGRIWACYPYSTDYSVRLELDLINNTVFAYKKENNVTVHIQDFNTISAEEGKLCVCITDTDSGNPVKIYVTLYADDMNAYLYVSPGNIWNETWQGYSWYETIYAEYFDDRLYQCMDIIR